MKKVLIIDSDSVTAQAIKGRLYPEVDVRIASDIEEGLGCLWPESVDAVIIDAGDKSRLGLIDQIRAKDENLYVIALSALQDMETMVEVIKRGAFDCLAKPVNLDELELCLEKAFKNLDLHRRLKDLLSDAYSEYKIDAIIGNSRQMEEIYKTIGTASQSKVTVLIQGESGTGKELIARAIHYNSRQKGEPFVALNCSALVETLLESELFGHEKGAFTGAVLRKEGKFEAARGGTVFLDEIGDMSQALQVKLLRVLQERSFERVGGSDTVRTDVRVIAATNRDLKDLTLAGSFREDLYYRLKVMTIDVPPLRARKEDIPLLVGHLLEKANRELHKKVRKVPERVMESLTDYEWPGNVRELENVITRGVALAKGDVLMDVYLPGLPGLTGKDERDGVEGWRPAALDDIESAHILRALEYTKWNKSRAANLLKVSLPRLERKIRKYDLKKGA